MQSKYRNRMRLAAIPALALAITLLPAHAVRAQVQTTPPASSQANPPVPPADTADQAAAANERTVRLSDAEGDVKVYQGDQLVFPNALVNMPLTQGMRIVTGSDGRAEIQFEDGSVARAAPNSSIELAQLGRSPDGTLVTEIDAVSGLSYYEINGQGGQYTIQFGPHLISPSGNAVFRIDLDSNTPDIADMQGNLQIFEQQNLVVSTSAGQSVSFNPDDPALYSLSQTIMPDSWDQWNSDRDEQLTELQQQATQASAQNGNPENPAWDDLDYYGDWYNVPGYGQAWAPSGVGADWDPFGVGAWGYYPAFGYTWISGYPWGWWPYHCGAWDWVDGYGWLWFPGNCGWGAYGNGWYPYVSVWHIPPHYRVPPRPYGPPFHRIRPVHGPEHRIDGYPLVPVNRGQQFASVFQPVGSGVHAPPRALEWKGHTVQPIHSLRPPSSVYSPSGGFGGTVHPQPVIPHGGFRSPYAPVRPRTPHTFNPGSGYHAQPPANYGNQPHPGEGNRFPFGGFRPMPTPRFQRAPEPRQAPAPHPVFRPAQPAPAFHPPPAPRVESHPAPHHR